MWRSSRHRSLPSLRHPRAICESPWWDFEAELWNGNRESLTSLFSLDPERSMLAWTWTTHPAKEVLFEKRFAESRWAHLNRRRFTRNTQINSWLTDLLASETLPAAATSPRMEHA